MNEPAVTPGEGGGSTPPVAVTPPVTPPAPPPAPVTPPPAPQGTTEPNIDQHPRFQGLMSSLGKAQARVAELEGSLQVAQATHQTALSQTSVALAEEKQQREALAASVDSLKGESAKYKALVENREEILPELYDLIPATTDPAALEAALVLAKEKSKAIVERTRSGLAQGSISVATPPRAPQSREWSARMIEGLSDAEWAQHKDEIYRWYADQNKQQ